MNSNIVKYKQIGQQFIECVYVHGQEKKILLENISNHFQKNVHVLRLHIIFTSLYIF